jgi:hypothetical protein
MTRRKGERAAQMNERDYPHIIEIEVPGDGLKGRLMDMHEGHHARGLVSRRRGSSV